MKKLLFLLVMVVSLSASNIVIATGGKTGNYFKVGKDLNKKVFKNRAKVINTQGSIENLLLVASGKADIALTQSDALVLLDLFYMDKNKKHYELVDVVGKIYTETLHLLINKKSKIKTLKDLNGKVVSFGGSKSGNSVTATNIEENNDLQFKSILDVPVAKAIKMVDQNKLDALFYVTKSPSSFINKFKNIKMLSIEANIPKNLPLTQINIPKSQYKFLKTSVKTYGVDTLVIVKKGFKNTQKVKNYLKTIPTANTKIALAQKKTNTKKEKNLFKIDQRVLKKYSNIYGNGALVRLNYISKKVSRLQDEKLVTKLKEVNNLVNRLKYLTDKRLWGKDDHWATSLESFGTGYSDTEELAMIKFLFLTKLGLDPNKLKLIEKNKPLKIKNKKYKQNIALAYFHKPSENPIILEYDQDKKSIYKLKNQFKYKVIKKSQNPTWQKLFSKNFNKRKADQVLGKLN